MGKIERLVSSYAKYIAVPWRNGVAPDQRVVFCIYHSEDELRLRHQIGEFEIATVAAKHDWIPFELKDTFAEWLTSQRYAEKYFHNPELLSPLNQQYLGFITDKFQKFLEEKKANNNSVVALLGVASLFGFITLKSVLDKLSPLVSGRLLVLFPGTHENNNYRLLDGYDGWNYLAVCITEDEDQ